jgi:Uma2 family endonuclease
MAITQRMTLEQFLELPEEKPALELIDGVVVQKVAPQWEHSVLQFQVARLFNVFAQPLKLAFAVPELRASYGRDSLVPDVAVYRWERIPRNELGEVVSDPPETADIAVEIVSPSQRVRDLVDKCRRYIANGTSIALVVDPETRVVVRLGPDGRVETLRGNDRIDLDLVLPGFRLTVQELFAMLRLD